jgi:hypothetical protein
MRAIPYGPGSSLYLFLSEKRKKKDAATILIAKKAVLIKI